jgi:CBS domain-containing protein
MDRNRKNQLLVIDAGGRLVGALNNLDLMNAKVI